MPSCGILSLANSNYEWLIPWWFQSIRKFSSLPIHIIDIGLSSSMKNWCDRHLTREELILENAPFPKEKIDPLLQKKWETLYFGSVWDSRPAWFAKPTALLFSPFTSTLFLDLDCEVRGGLEDLFSKFPSFAICKEPPLSHKIALEHEIIQKGDSIYNSGVVIFPKDSPIVKKWAALSYECSGQYMGDQDLLSSILMQEKGLKWARLPQKYNCRPQSKMAKEAVIVHHVGLGGKRDILAQMLTQTLEII